MASEEIIAALKNAIDRGESLEDARQIMINSGYDLKEVQEASKFVGSGSLNLQESLPELELTLPEQKKGFFSKMNPFQKNKKTNLSTNQHSQPQQQNSNPQIIPTNQIIQHIDQSQQAMANMQNQTPIPQTQQQIQSMQENNALNQPVQYSQNRQAFQNPQQTQQHQQNPYYSQNQQQTQSNQQTQTQHQQQYQTQNNFFQRTQQSVQNKKESQQSQQNPYYPQNQQPQPTQSLQTQQTQQNPDYSQPPVQKNNANTLPRQNHLNQLRPRPGAFSRDLKKIKPRKTSYFKEVILLVILLVLIGVLSLTIIYRATILGWFGG